MIFDNIAINGIKTMAAVSILDNIYSKNITIKLH
jgi:hypothetical protein